MTQQKSTIPVLKNRQELADFWDTHGVTDYVDELHPVDLTFALEEPKQETVIVRFHKGVKKHLEHLAHTKGLTVSSLLRMWTMEHMQKKPHSAR